MSWGLDLPGEEQTECENNPNEAFISGKSPIRVIFVVDISLVDARSLFSGDLVGHGVARSIASTGITPSSTYLQPPPVPTPNHSLQDPNLPSPAGYHQFLIPKSRCPGLGGTSPTSHSVWLLPKTKWISPPAPPIRSSCVTQLLFHGIPFMVTFCMYGPFESPEVVMRRVLLLETDRVMSLNQGERRR